MKIKNRFRGVKGSCYLTHGSDDYDHRALKKAIRATGKDIIRESIEDTHDVEIAQKPTSYRLVVYTQVYENYGYRWKAKGGNEYHMPITDITEVNYKSLSAIVEANRPKIERTGNDDVLHSHSEHIIDWQVYGNNELTEEEEMYA